MNNVPKFRGFQMMRGGTHKKPSHSAPSVGELSIQNILAKKLTCSLEIAPYYVIYASFIFNKFFIFEACKRSLIILGESFLRGYIKGIGELWIHSIPAWRFSETFLRSKVTVHQFLLEKLNL